jgi:thiol peroxidase
MERKGLIKFSGRDMTVIGTDLKVGQAAPEFTAQDNDWQSFKAIEKTQGKVRIIGSLLSLNTSVCDRETRHFNLEAAALGKEVSIIILSMDLPFTQKNWCGAAGVDQVITLSDHMEAEFGEKYGVLMKEARLLRRAVFVIDKAGKIVYVAYMAALGDEPDYGAVLAAAKNALA